MAISLDTKSIQNDLQPIVDKYSSEELHWISGYLYAIAQMQSLGNNDQVGHRDAATMKILFGTHTGNSRKIATWLHKALSMHHVNVVMQDVASYNLKEIYKEQILFIIISTHGEGDPPAKADAFYRALMSKRMKSLESIQYAVLALGDKSYQPFCKTGIDIDERISSLGAKRLLECQTCDVDYITTSKQWIEQICQMLESESLITKQMASLLSKKANVNEEEEFNQQNPFMATVLKKQLLSGHGAEKKRYHFELSVQHANIDFKPGDSLGILARNPNKLVEQINSICLFAPDEIVNTHLGEMLLRKALSRHYEITVLTKDLLIKHNEHSKNKDLQLIIDSPEALKKYLYGNNLADLLTSYPYTYSANELISILRPLPPRLYSISSSLEYAPDEVHVTIGEVRYINNDQLHEGACSTFLTDQIEVDDKLPVYIHSNESFRLPSDSSKPVIMIGAGTGVAPFRSFVQERAMNRKKGMNWLFFGDRRQATDYLYEDEWKKWQEQGVLTNLSVVFSRDHDQIKYVQHKMYENRAEFMAWINKGAYIYVCGDKEYMAKDVNDTIVRIVQEEMGLSIDGAETFVKVLKKQHRYQEDVY